MKKSTYRRMLSGIMTGALVFSMLSPLNAFAAKKTSDGFTYKVSKQNATITGYKGKKKSITIPSRIGEYNVTSIGKSAFEKNDKIKSVTVPNTVTSIQYAAFSKTTALRTIKIEDGSKLSSIGEAAFYFSGINKIKMPDTVTSIGKRTFWGCQDLSSATLSKKLTKLPEYSFYYTGLKSIKIPAKIKKIDASAFSCSASLTKVTGGSKVTEVGDDAFSYCYSLTSVPFAESLKKVGTWAFSYTPINETKFGANGLEIKYEAMAGNDAISTLELPSSVTSIEYGAFSNCWNLYSIKMPDKITSLTGGAFRNTQWEEYVDKDVYVDTFLYQSKTGRSSIDVKAGTKSICDFAMDGQKNLTNIRIPDGVSTIGEAACFNTGLKSVTIPESVTYIGELAFGYEKYEFERDWSYFYNQYGDDAWDKYSEYITSTRQKDNVLRYNNYQDYGLDAPNLRTLYCTGDCTRVAGFTIYGKKGSAAESYAQANGFNFVAK